MCRYGGPISKALKLLYKRRKGLGRGRRGAVGEERGGEGAEADPGLQGSDVLPVDRFPEALGRGGDPCRNVGEPLFDVLDSELKLTAACLADFVFDCDRRAGHPRKSVTTNLQPRSYYELAAQNSLHWLASSLRDGRFSNSGRLSTGNTFNLGYRPAECLNTCAKALHTAYYPSKKEGARYGILARSPACAQAITAANSSRTRSSDGPAHIQFPSRNPRRRRRRPDKRLTVTAWRLQAKRPCRALR